MAVVPRDHKLANDESRARLRTLVSRLDHGRLATSVMEGWSASALLAHLAFWDRFTLKRMESRLAGAAVPDIEAFMHALNDAALPQWTALQGEVAARDAIEAADAVDQFVAALPREAIAQILAEGRPRWLFRSEHRREHLEEIERALPR